APSQRREGGDYRHPDRDGRQERSVARRLGGSGTDRMSRWLACAPWPPTALRSAPAIAAVRGDQREDLRDGRRCRQRAALPRIVVRIHLHDVGAGQIEPREAPDQAQHLARRWTARLRRLDAGREGGIDDVKIEREEDLASPELVEDSPAQRF